MRYIIYALADDPDYVAFDRAVPGAIVNTAWDDWTPVAVVEGSSAVVIENKEGYYELHVAATGLSAQQVLCGGADGYGVRVTPLSGDSAEDNCENNNSTKKKRRPFGEGAKVIEPKQERPDRPEIGDW